MIKPNRFKIHEKLNAITLEKYFIVEDTVSFFSISSYYLKWFSSNENWWSLTLNSDYAYQFSSFIEAQEAIITYIWNNSRNKILEIRKERALKQNHEKIKDLTKNLKTYSVPPFIK